ncbi:hypothetical protein [Parasphingorhabdus halotolerans]|uniref:hypothetical protein n=1 Tax=Parasphingorhabdus halotolerans TaxID=2725558 RepID=UPI001B3A4405
MTDNADAAQEFYGAVVGWTFADSALFVEVRQRIQLCVLALAKPWLDTFAEAAANASRSALVRASNIMDNKSEVEDLEQRSQMIIDAGASTHASKASYFSDGGCRTS